MLNYGRLRSVAANMRRCGLSQILVADDDSIFYLIGCRVKAQERCGVTPAVSMTLPLPMVFLTSPPLSPRRNLQNR